MKTKRVFILFSVLVLCLMIASPVMAAPLSNNPNAKHEIYKGTITAVSVSGIILELKDGSSVTAVLTPETRIRIPTVKEATVAGLAVKMTVVVQTVRKGDTLTAVAVVVVPGKPAKTHVVGIVSAYEAGVSIAIQAKDGKFYGFLLNQDTRILPAERKGQLDIGALVTIISPRDVSVLAQTATGIVVHPASVE